jgi:hypothetical protein
MVRLPVFAARLHRHSLYGTADTVGTFASKVIADKKGWFILLSSVQQ